MNFLKECASRLDSGASAQDVLTDMHKRYTTVRCMNVKTCIVRSMCQPSEAYIIAKEALCIKYPNDREDIIKEKSENEEIQHSLRQLPPKWNDNVYQLKPTRLQMKECKRLSAHSAIQKNKKRIRVHGRELLAEARKVLDNCKIHNLVKVAFALMLVTGRRTCEILNGTSRFESSGDYSINFTGIAKRRGYNPTIVIPVLARSDIICSAVTYIRNRQKNITLSNKEVSSRYQSLLCRNLIEHYPWKQCKKVHGLRGVYACMALRLFQWEDDASDAYVAMCILGHTGLQESLVYTTYHIGDDFSMEPCLGKGNFTPHQSVEREGLGVINLEV